MNVIQFISYGVLLKFYINMKNLYIIIIGYFVKRRVFKCNFLYELNLKMCAKVYTILHADSSVS